MGGLSCIIITALIGIIVSVLVRPLFVERYLFPACALVWLFFAIICGSIKSKRKLIFVCGVLLLMGFTTFLSSFDKERKENIEFSQFYTYLKKEIAPQDMFIFLTSTDGHLEGICAYLFPGHRTLIEYNELADTDKFQGRGVWVLVQGASVIPPESNAEFRGDFGWYVYRFKLYYTEYPEAFARL
ncbi:hypothetical protein ACYULU_04995 [Breznakiellaceae bacterium SP9]